MYGSWKAQHCMEGALEISLYNRTARSYVKELQTETEKHQSLQTGKLGT